MLAAFKELMLDSVVDVGVFLILVSMFAVMFTFTM
jgi:hypothetical protein